MAKPLGMMDAAYFTGRGEIIGWLNATFGMRVERIEEAANGAILCQILDAVFPGVVAMGKVDWAARSPHEMVNNYKVAQAAMNGRVDRHLDVEKLVRAKPQDSLELMQWAKSFFERSYDSTPYDARGRRARGKNADAVPSFATGGAAAAAAAPPAGAGSSAIGRPGAAGRVGATPAAAARTRAAAAPGATAGAAAAPLGARTPGAPLAGGAAAGSARPLPLVGRSRPPSPQHAAPANGGVGGASAAALQRKVDEVRACPRAVSAGGRTGCCCGRRPCAWTWGRGCSSVL